MSRFEIADDWREHVDVNVDELFNDRLGPEITADAKRYAPKKTGELADSIGFDVEDHSLIIKADAPYAAYVELGHDLDAWGHETDEEIPPQPYLRPAVYQARS